MPAAIMISARPKPRSFLSGVKSLKPEPRSFISRPLQVLKLDFGKKVETH
jgi:hypothetical protein